MSPKRLDDAIAVDAQISAADVSHLAALGYKSIICNRPDGETPGQPAFADIAKAAAAAGLQARHIPVVSGTLPPTAVAEFADALESMPHPVFAYCRSGTRSTFLWTAARLRKPDAQPQAIARAAAEAGYDVSPLLRR